MNADVPVANPVLAMYSSRERLVSGLLRSLRSHQWLWIGTFAAGVFFAPLPGPWWALLVSGAILGFASLAVVMELLERYLGLAYDRIYSAMSESERYEVDRWKAQLNVRVAAHIHGRR